MITRTLGPLHLEDLEPHRFEDLIRQLLYDFRSWRSLEATGRSGGDAGFDARGWESIPTAGDEQDEESEESALLTAAERLWLVQCKREKNIGPTKLLRYLNEIPENERSAIYGVVFAAACEFSKRTRDAFRTSCRDLGFSEAYLWGKGEIEDAIFQPKNDHLLFAYFGVSLRARRRTLTTDIRARLAIKRKARRVITTPTVLIRDASDDTYPHNGSEERGGRGRWKVHRFGGCRHDGICLVLRRHFAFFSSDGKGWDYAETMDDAKLSRQEDPWAKENGTDHDSKDRHRAMQEWDELPKHEQAWLEVLAVVPYESVIAIDEDGDELVRHPHVYTTSWHPERGPCTNDCFAQLDTNSSYDRRSGTPCEVYRIHKFRRKDIRFDKVSDLDKLKA